MYEPGMTMEFIEYIITAHAIGPSLAKGKVKALDYQT